MANGDIHPDMQDLAFLLGRWAGTGQGIYPTIASFQYGEEIALTSLGRPFFHYTQRTWSLLDQSPLHAETGYWRRAGANGVEVTLAHPTGIAELQQGSVEGNRVTLESTSVARSGTAKRVDAVRRVFWLEDGVLRYTLSMAAVGQPLQQHLSAQLRRV